MLLERDHQLERLGQLLADAATGRGRLVLLSGEAGAGKSALVREFLGAVQVARVLRSFCEDLSVPDPLGPLYDLAREAHVPFARDLDRPQLSIFSDVLAVLAGDASPTIVVIEDLHWADDATLDFVRFLGRRIDATHLLILLTVRTESHAGQRRVRRALVDVPPQNLVRLDVPLLSLQAVTAFTSPLGLDGDAIYHATAGNPFFVTELAAANGSQALPQSVTEMVLDRVDRLGPTARSCIDLVSLFPRAVEARFLLAMIGDAGGLDTALDAGLLERTGQDIAFRHDIARRAVEAAMPLPVRRRLNGDILAALLTVPDVPVARLAHHAREAGDAESILAFAPAAGAWAASMGAHHEAASHYRAAVDLSPNDPALSHALAFEYSLTGRLADAIAIEQAALELYRKAGERVKQGDCLRHLSRFSYLAGRRQDTDRYGDAAVAILENETAGPELAMAYSNHAQLDMLADRAGPTLDWGNKAIALAERLGRADIVCATLNNIGNVQRWSNPDEARRLLGRSLEMAIANDWHEHAARAYANWSCMEIELMQFAAADTRLAEGIAYCAERDLDTLRLYMIGWLAQLRLKQGHWSEAADIAGRVLDSELATPLARFQAADVVARLRIRRGDPGDEVPLAELTAVLAHGREFQRLAPYATLMAERAWITGGNVEEALALIAEAASLISEPLATKDLDFWHSILSGAPSDWHAIAQQRHAVGMPFEEALALLMAGNGAEQAALGLLDRLGASAVTGRARTILASRGLRGPRRSTMANAASLTNRELEVLKLLGAGLSNKAIAGVMHVSPKTVDHHVSAVLGKLGAQSRSQAAAIGHQRSLI